MQNSHIHKSAIDLKLEISMYILFSEFNLLEFYKTIYKESTRILQKNLLEFYKKIY